MDQFSPSLRRGGHVTGGVTKHGPEARAVVNLIGRKIPFEDANLGGIEGETESLVGNLEHRFDPTSFLVLGLQSAIGNLGRAQRGVGGPGEMDAETQKNGDAKSGGEG